MKLTPGQLYFINEQDVRTGQRSHYYKIGIVRESEGRDSIKRLREHQTGNLRKLYVVVILNIPAVEYIETNLHYLFARNRVMVEWLELSDTELETAIAKANEFKTEMEENLPIIQRAEELKSLVSNGSKIQPTDEHLSLHVQYLTYNEIVSSCEFALEKYDEYLLAAIEKGVVASGSAKIQERAGAKRFDAKLFAKTYPELHEKYSETKTEVKGSFRILIPKDWVIDVSVMPTEQVNLLSDLIGKVAFADRSLETGFVLHEKHLAVIEIMQHADYKSEIAGINLRVHTSNSDGIKGICSWIRCEKIVNRLNKNAIKQNSPETYNTSLIEQDSVKVLLVGNNNLMNKEVNILL